MKKYDLLTPEGTRDLIFDECEALRLVEDKLRTLYKSHGYSEIVTPGLEFYDVFNNKSRTFAQEKLYKLTDGKGRILVLRPDSTMPIARVVGTRLRDRNLPLRIFYDQMIYRTNPKDSGRDDEFSQSGVEIIGGEEMRTDIEALSIAVEVMKGIGDENYRFEIGDSAFLPMISENLNLSEAETDNLRVYIQTKNYPALREMLSAYGDNKYAKALTKLPELFGGSEVFEAAEKIMPDENTKTVLTKLRQLYNALCELGIEDKVTVDLGLVSKNADYYTGVVFNGYVEGYGMPVLTGGRYDKLLVDFGVDTPAIGFAVNISSVADALIRKSGESLVKPADILVHSDCNNIVKAVRHCNKLISDGLKAEYSALETIEEAREYAASRGIKELCVISDNGTVTEKISGGQE